MNSRATDPVTSFIAGDKIEESGKAQRQRDICLDIVKNYRGLTVAEVAKCAELERHIPSRRLPELRLAGLVYNPDKRKCMVTGNMSMTWEAK